MQSRRLVRSHRRPERVAPLPMLTKSDGQTEDGHAIMTLDTFHSFQSHRKPVEKGGVDCDADLSGVVGSCR